MHLRLALDEAHKAYKGSSNKPARIAAWREVLAEGGIALVVTAVTATPLWDKKSKAQVGLAKRACTVLGLEVGEGETAVGVLTENLVEVSGEEGKNTAVVEPRSGILARGGRKEKGETMPQTVCFSSGFP